MIELLSRLKELKKLLNLLRGRIDECSAMNGEMLHSIDGTRKWETELELLERKLRGMLLYWRLCVCPGIAERLQLFLGQENA